MEALRSFCAKGEFPLWRSGKGGEPPAYEVFNGGGGRPLARSCRMTW
jgi:hypothetical protein